MPKTQKENLSLDQLRQEAINHNIEFPGIVLPDEWPPTYRNYFRTIRSIGFISEENFNDSQFIPDRQKVALQDRADKLRIQAKDLLSKPNQKETAWRKLEAPVLERFSSSIHCEYCNYETCRPYHEADFQCEIHQEELGTKRARRKFCNCDTPACIAPKDSTEHIGDIFHTKKEEAITHVLGDDLEGINIPMKPDLVIGLSAPSNMPRNQCHYPTKSGEILLPFLVVEAKREHLTYGPKATQSQTSFAIRRLLKAQNNLKKRNSSCEPCLVWFFASHGDQWRLQAGIYEKRKVKIYDLWQGSLQSRDESLQLLLIVDFVWSWARDIYHPIITDAISNSDRGLRSLCRLNVDGRGRSPSVSTFESSVSNTDDSDCVEIDALSETTGDPAVLLQSDELELHPDQSLAEEALSDAKSHEFQQWAASQKTSSPWTQLGMIRHSNIVHFEFRCYDCRPHNRVRKRFMEKGDTPLDGVLSSSALLIPAEQLYQIATLWTTKNLPTIPRLDEGNGVHVTFYFETFCDKSTWKIKRILNCLLWNRVTTIVTKRSQRSTATHRPKHVYSHIRPRGSEMRALERSVLDVRNIHGRDSVICALTSVSLILRRQEDTSNLGWELCEDMGLSEDVLNVLEYRLSRMRRRVNGRPQSTSCEAVLWVESSSEFELKSKVRGLELDKRSGDSTLALRQPQWPATTCMLCLFILIDDGYDSEGNLYRLLQAVTDRRDFIAHKWDLEEWRVAVEWRTAVKDDR